MTHDELLALVNDEIEVCEPECNQHQRVNAPWLALRALVELHKPKTWQGIEMVCEGCGTDIEQNYNSGYPCPTIQAIEKELK